MNLTIQQFENGEFLPKDLMEAFEAVALQYAEQDINIRTAHRKAEVALRNSYRRATGIDEIRKLKQEDKDTITGIVDNNKIDPQRRLFLMFQKSPVWKDYLFLIDPDIEDAQPIGIHRFTGKHEKNTYEVSTFTNQKKIEDQLFTDLKRVGNINKINDRHGKDLFRYLDASLDLYEHGKIKYISEPNEELTYTYKVIHSVEPRNTLDQIPSWAAFLNRLSDPEAYAAWVWSIYEPKHFGPQALFLHGINGRDGKSTTTSVIAKQFGGKKYATTIPAKVFSVKNEHGLARCVGKRLLTIADNTNTKIATHQYFLNITGGDEVPINEKFEREYSVIIDARILIHGNPGLIIKSADYDKERILWIKVERTDERTLDWKQGLESEYDLFLQYCKWAYEKKCPDHRIIESASSDAIKEQYVGSDYVVLIDDLRKYFDIDKTKTDWKVCRQEFQDTITANLCGGKIDDGTRIRDFKSALFSIGLTDFNNPNGERIDIGGEVVKGYRGIRVKDRYSQDPPKDPQGNPPTEPEDFDTDPSSGPAVEGFNSVPFGTKPYIVIDYETYAVSKAKKQKDVYSLGSMSNADYIKDPRFKIFGAAIRLPGQPVVWVNEKDIKATLAPYADTHTLVAHNIAFDGLITKLHYGITFKEYCDTMGLVKYLGLGGSLQESAKLVGMEKGDHEDFTKHTPEMETYCIQDATICDALYNQILTKANIPAIEYEIIDLTCKQNLEGIKVADAARAYSAIRADLETISTQIANTYQKDKIFIKDINRNDYIKEVIQTKTGIKLSSIKKGSLEVKKAKASNAWIDAFLTSRDTYKSLQKWTKAVARIVGQERIYNFLQYYGASTGRFSSGGAESGKINIQNFPAHTSIQSIKAIRKMLGADEGKEFIACDLSSIEARVVAWIANEKELLKRFEDGDDIYCWFAGKVFNKVITKEDQLRMVGKKAILGLGYGLGKQSFIDNCRKELPKESPITDKQIADIHSSYHGLFKNIKSFARDLLKCFEDCYTTGKSIKVGEVMFKRKGSDTVMILLPTGRTLYYRNLKPVDGKYGRCLQTRAGKKVKYVSARLLIENISQGIARDIMCEQMVRLNKMGYKAKFTIHDEIVFEVSPEQRTEAEKVIEAEMSKSSIVGLPIACEINRNVRTCYGK